MAMWGLKKMATMNCRSFKCIDTSNLALLTGKVLSKHCSLNIFCQFTQIWLTSFMVFSKDPKCYIKHWSRFLSLLKGCSRLIHSLSIFQFSFLPQFHHRPGPNWEHPIALNQRAENSATSHFIYPRLQLSHISLQSATSHLSYPASAISHLSYPASAISHLSYPDSATSHLSYP